MSHHAGGPGTAAVAFRPQVTDAKSGTNDHILVTYLHASSKIVVRKLNGFIRFLQNLTVNQLRSRRPPGILVTAWYDDNQTDVRVLLPQAKYFQCGKRIKSERTATVEGAVTFTVDFSKGFCEHCFQESHILPGKEPVPREADACILISVILFHCFHVFNPF